MKFLRLITAITIITCVTTCLFSSPTHPNVLIIVADDMGYGELTCQGFKTDIPTPFIDSISTNGIRFTNAYVSAPYCSPSRAGLLTGRYATRYGHEFNPGPAEITAPTIGLPIEEKTIADRLKAAGYISGWFGKSHMGYAPQFHPYKRGFDEYFGFLGGMHDYLNAEADKNDMILEGTEQIKDLSYTTDSFAQKAANFIQKNSKSPWLCYLAFNAVHMPLESTTKYLARFPNIKDQKRRTYAAMESAMDDGVGLVLNKLRELNLEENTLVIFLSDNGGPTPTTTSSNGPLRGFKAQTWEGGIRIPFIIQWKNHLTADQIDKRPIIALDILPTVLAASGLEAKPEWKLDGVNLIPYLTTKTDQAPHEVLFWRFGRQIALRKGEWKLVKAPLNGVEALIRGGKGTTQNAQLYNLDRDIGETTNLASTYPDKVKELSKIWNQINQEMVPAKWGHNSGKADE